MPCELPDDSETEPADEAEPETVEYDGLSGFGDRSQVSDWGIIPMGWAVTNGIINGTGDDNLSPRGAIDRAQCVAILLRFIAIADNSLDK